MPRYIRNTVILAKVEGTPGTDAVPVVGSDAVLVSDMTITPLDAQNINRDLVRGYFGGSEQLVSTAFSRVQFTVELAGSGTANVAPQWGDLLLGCGFAESILGTPNRVEYLPISSSLKTLTIYYFDDGVRHILNYCMGNVRFEMKAGDRPKMMFDFVGREGTISSTAAGATTLTAWRTPVGMAAVNVVDITLGCTYSAGALASGTVYPSTGLTLDLGNVVNYTALLSTDRVDLSQREVTGHMDLDLTAANEVTFTATVKANTTTGLGFTVGTAAGNKIIFHAPAHQIINPSKQEINGSRLIGYDLRLVPTTAGNDELRIITQ